MYIYIYIYIHNIGAGARGGAPARGPAGRIPLQNESSSVDENNYLIRSTRKVNHTIIKNTHKHYNGDAPARGPAGHTYI